MFFMVFRENYAKVCAYKILQNDFKIPANDLKNQQTDTNPKNYVNRVFCNLCGIAFFHQDSAKFVTKFIKLQPNS